MSLLETKAESDWVIVYERAIRDDNTLFFPQRLSQAFLDQARRTMGSYVFANQYQNEIVPDDQKVFKKSWLRYFNSIPDGCNTFGFIDPAISLENGADYTAVVIVDCDKNNQWYIKYAKRYRINPTEIVSLCFQIQEQFHCKIIGIEDVAYQKALLYMLSEEMKRRNKIIPVHGVHPGTDKTKETRILGLVPRFEWGRILINQGLHDLELELHTFPRGRHDDLLDALSQIEQIAYYPGKDKPSNEPPAPNHPTYEEWYRKNLYKRASEERYDSDD